MNELNTPPLEETNSLPQDAEQNPAAKAGKSLSARELRAKRKLQKRDALKTNDLAMWLVILPIVFFMGLGSGWLVWGRSLPAAAAAANTADAQVKINENVKRYDVSIDGNPSIGPEDAPITIVEFSDYQCPYCVRWYQEVFSRLMETYKGKIRFVYRDFPLYSIHPNAESAAEAANCAGEQNAYWQYHDALFVQKYGLGNEAYNQYAGELGLNAEQFSKCVNDHIYKAEVEADVAAASSLGVSSTPTFFVNGLAVIGAQPFEVFQQLIDKELAGEIPK